MAFSVGMNAGPQDHTKDMPEEVVKTYHKLRERILSLGEGIQIRPRQYGIVFEAKSNFAGKYLQKPQVKLFLNLPKGKLDPRKLARDVSNLGHWCNGDYEISIKPDDDLDYIMIKTTSRNYIVRLFYFLFACSHVQCMGSLQRRARAEPRCPNHSGPAEHIPDNRNRHEFRSESDLTKTMRNSELLLQLRI